MKKKNSTKGKKVKKTIEPELIELGKHIRELRIKGGYSSAEKFAYEHNLSRTSYSKCETGANMTYMSLRKLLDIFGISVQDFFGSFKK